MNTFKTQGKPAAWIEDAVFYHIYPLGFTGAPFHNDFHSDEISRINEIYGWIDHMKYLGVNSLYLGPLFESSTHGYDTADYFKVDRRLGTNQDLKNLVKTLHDNGIRVILDCVFNHVGRNFWAFRDVQQNLNNSWYCHWISGLDFNGKTPYNDPFSYDTWAGHYELVKLNLDNEWVRKHLFEAVSFWIKEFEIDGLRMDAAEDMDINFLSELNSYCKGIRLDFFILGEVVSKDYSVYYKENALDSVTNYECYKGLYSSFNDKNLFEIAYSLNRQFGNQGIYNEIPLYNFVDNHDVNRISSTLNDTRQLQSLYTILFTMPGIPSIYYGSEWGITGKRDNHSDTQIRQSAAHIHINRNMSYPYLADIISWLSKVRKDYPAIRSGNYKELHVSSLMFSFSRTYQSQSIVVAVNGHDSNQHLNLNLENIQYGRLQNIQNPDESYDINNHNVYITNISPLTTKIFTVIY